MTSQLQHEQEQELQSHTKATMAAQSQEEEGPEDTHTEEEEQVVARAREQLTSIAGKVHTLTQRLERVGKRYGAQAGAVAANWWAQRTLHRAPAHFNRLGTGALREECGAIVEGLMKELLHLDAVESHGDESVRDRRRALVKRINDKLLPRADAALSRATRLMEEDRRRQAILAEEAKTQAEARAATDTEAETQSVDDDDARHGDHDSNDHGSDGETSERSKEAAEEPQSPGHSRPEPRPMRYKISERQKDAAILCQVPEGTTLRDVEVAVDRSSGELTVTVGDLAPLIFNVSSQGLDALATTYTLTSPTTLRVTIPKLRVQRPRRMAPPTARRYVQHNQVPQRMFGGPAFAGRNPSFAPIWGF